MPCRDCDTEWEIEKPFGMGLNDIIMTVNADMDSSLLLIYIHIYSCPYDVSVDMSVRAFEGSSRSLTCSFQIKVRRVDSNLQ